MFDLPEAAISHLVAIFACSRRLEKRRCSGSSVQGLGSWNPGEHVDLQVYPFPSLSSSVRSYARVANRAQSPGPRDAHRRARPSPSRGTRTLRACSVSGHAHLPPVARFTRFATGRQGIRDDPGGASRRAVEEPLYSLVPPAVTTPSSFGGFIRPPTRVPSLQHHGRPPNERAHRVSLPICLDRSNRIARRRSAQPWQSARSGFMQDVVAGVALGEPSAGGGGCAR